MATARDEIRPCDEALLAIEGLRVTYGSRMVLQDFELSVPRQSLLALMGPNGSGKTTLINVITRYLQPDAGRISFKGINLLRHPPHRMAALGVTRTFQDVRLILDLTVSENLCLFLGQPRDESILRALVHPLASRRSADEVRHRLASLLQELDLTSVRDSRAGEISFGQAKLLALGCCMALDGELLLLDEPIAGVQPHRAEQIGAILRQLCDRGKTIVFIEHNTGFIQSLADEVVFLHAGAILTAGPYDRVSKHPRVRAAYL